MISLKNIGENIDYDDYNAMVYLLRKFKRLSTSLQIGANDLSSDYGDFHFTDGFESIGSNFILNNDVTVNSDSVLKNAFYTFIFTVLDVNLSGTVNKRTVKITNGTGENGELELIIPANLIDNNEVILPNFNVEVVFDEHEYYTSIKDANIDLSCNKFLIKSNELATITIHATRDDVSLSGLTLFINVNGRTYKRTTNNQGVATVNYRGTGDVGLVNVRVMNKSIIFYDYDNPTKAEFSGNTVKLGGGGFSVGWLITNGEVIIDWGDGSRTTVNNPKIGMTHTYTDGLSNHTVLFIGNIVGLGNYCFYDNNNLTDVIIGDNINALGEGCFEECSSLTAVNIPNSVINLGGGCFAWCSILPSIEIPSSVSNIGKKCFLGSNLLDDYQLYWETNPPPYVTEDMPVGPYTVITIPYGTTQVYLDAGYPPRKLVERNP